MEIGFIGLGHMGAPMAANLVAAGHRVTGFDPAGVTTPGVVSVASAAESATGRGAVITMLPNGAILRSVYAAIVPAASPGTVLIDCSTVDVADARAVAEQAGAAGLDALDAPVSGGVGGAAAGTLTFMAGGPASALELARPLFETMGSRLVHCGGAGAGQAAKICNNMILGVTMAGVCEAFALADKLSLDRARLFDVVSTSSGSCWSVNAYCPAPGVGPKSPADNGYAPGFAAELMLKDLTLAQSAAQAADAAAPIGAAAAAIFARFLEEGGRGRDFSALLPWLEKKTHEMRLDGNKPEPATFS